MLLKLLIVDGDGTISKVRNPFYEVAKELGCYQKIRAYVEEYLNGSITYNKLIQLQNPIYKTKAREYAQRRGWNKFDCHLLTIILQKILGYNYISLEIKVLLENIRKIGFEIALISSGWDIITKKLADEAKIDYWKSNEVLFLNGEFSGTKINFYANKIEEFKVAKRYFNVEYSNIAYWGDSEFDLEAMNFLHNNGGRCLAYQVNSDGITVEFPDYVRCFHSIQEMEEFLKVGKLV